MDIRKTAILLLLLVTGIFASNSAEPSVKPVKWRTIIKTTGPDSGTVTFKAIIAPGWHLYALTLPEGGPKPTSFDLSESKGIKLGSAVTPSRKAIETDDPLFGMKLAWWDANVDFTVPFTITDHVAAHLSAKITYMACDGQSCRPPTTENIGTPIKLKKQ